MSYELLRLRNGAFTLRSLDYAETMHPSVGPIEEAHALYVQQLRIAERAKQTRGVFVVWDIGLGAAANAIAVLGALADVATDVLLLSFDNSTAALRFALEHADRLNYITSYVSSLESLLARGEATRDRTTWRLHLGNFPDLVASVRPAPDAILFDPFSPARNPEMWTAVLFEQLFRALDRPCSLANFSRSTIFRVSLLLAGFYVGRGQPIALKEETTIAANTPSLVDNPLDKRWLERAQRSHSAEPLWNATYRKAPLTPATLARLRAHPQFSR